MTAGGGAGAKSEILPRRGFGVRLLLGDERGFTLPEMLVTVLVMLVVFFALHNVFETSVRIFGFGNDKVEAVEGARLGFERVERELRYAYPRDKSLGSGGDFLLLKPSNPDQRASSLDDNQATFGLDLDASRKIECPNLAGNCEHVQYRLTAQGSTAACSAAPCTLRRVSAPVPGSASGDPLAGNVDGPNGLRFEYLKADGATPAANEAEVAVVRVTLAVLVNRSGKAATQTLATDVALRNRAP